jgi:hypothetical protein
LPKISRKMVDLCLLNSTLRQAEKDNIIKNGRLVIYTSIGIIKGNSCIDKIEEGNIPINALSFGLTSKQNNDEVVKSIESNHNNELIDDNQQIIILDAEIILPNGTIIIEKMINIYLDQIVAYSFECENI